MSRGRHRMRTCMFCGNPLPYDFFERAFHIIGACAYNSQEDE